MGFWPSFLLISIALLMLLFWVRSVPWNWSAPRNDVGNIKLLVAACVLVAIVVLSWIFGGAL